MNNLVTKPHTDTTSNNDKYALALSDKKLHFLVIGAFGFLMVLIIQPLFSWFAKKDGVLFITFTYVFTLILVITFGIEIGQGFSGTGDMDFVDLLAGLFGFFIFFGIYLIGYLIYRKIKDHKNSQTKTNNVQ